MKLRISLDIDQTILDFTYSYNKYFNVDIAEQAQKKITKNVWKLRNNKEFWSGLPLLERPDFEPTCYCTKRINSKTYTRRNLAKYNLPIKPIYQIYTQSGNKADRIKGICDVLIDDSPFNVRQCLKVGFPAILIDRPCNQHVTDLPRVYKLNYKEIEQCLLTISL